MASFVPAKSQPLHNFELPPLLKWKKDGKSSGNPKRRRSVMSPSQRRDGGSASPPLCSTVRDYAAPTSPRMKQLAIGGEGGREWSSESEGSRKDKGGAIEYHRNHIKKSAFCSLMNSEEGMKSNSNREEDNRKERAVKMEINDEKMGESSNKLDEEDIKLWNLRPRNVKKKVDKAKVDGERNKDAVGKEGKMEEEKKKLSICICLTKEEIEEDIFALTGSKASRRPKRRPKNIQKQLDVTFPGLWLVSITPESY